MSISKFHDTLVYRRGTKFVRSTNHQFNTYLNKGKNNDLDTFINEYRRMADILLNELWSKEFTWNNPKKNITYKLCLKHNQIHDGCPVFLQTSGFNAHKNYKGCLSGRAFSSLCNQLIGIIRGVIKVANATNSPVVKPYVKNIRPELSSKHVDFQENQDSIFELTIRLSALFNKRGKDIKIPLKMHKMDKYYSEDLSGKLLKGISLSNNSISLRYEMLPNEEVIENDNVCDNVVGVDMGINKICSFSSGVLTPQVNSQGKGFGDIVNSIQRCKHNSKRYKRKLRERDCFINEVLNGVDFSNIDVLRLESNKGIKENTVNSNKYWKTGLIINKILNKCQVSQVDLWHCPSAYKSQRCFVCGFVHTANRVKEKFECLSCCHTNDADINASLNNSIKLPYQDVWLYRGMNKDCGFFWSENGVVLNDKTGNVAFPDIKKHKMEDFS